MSGDLSATQFMCLTKEKLTQFKTYEEAHDFAKRSGIPTDPVYVFELRYAFSGQWELSYDKST